MCACDTCDIGRRSIQSKSNKKFAINSRVEFVRKGNSIIIYTYCINFTFGSVEVEGVSLFSSISLVHYKDYLTVESSTPSSQENELNDTKVTPENITEVSGKPYSQIYLSLRPYLSNPWIAGFAGGLATVLIFAVIGLFLPFQDANNLTVVLGPAILLAAYFSKNYFSAIETGWRAWLKLAGITIGCLVIGAILFITINSGRVPQKVITDWKRSTGDEYSYAASVIAVLIFEIPLLIIFAYPISRGNWRFFLTLALIPLRILNLIRRFIWAFFGLGSQSSGGISTNEMRARRRDEAISKGQDPRV